MICVLDVTSGPARGRRFWLRTNQQIEIGRISSADIAVPADPHMSRRHLILEGTLSSFRVRDVGSANGTFVNNARISSVELCTGDQIRAGETTFEVSVLDDDENPHAKDGVTFSGSLTRTMTDALPTAGPPGYVPARQLATAGGYDDAELTRRCPPQAPTQTDLPPSSRVTSRAASGGTVLSPNTWWSDFDFAVSDVPCLLDESPHRPSKSGLLIEMLQRLEPEHVLTAVLNVECLGRFGRQQLGTLVELGLVTWHAPSVCTIVDDRSRDYARMIECTPSQDALILIGSHAPLDRGWLDQLVRQVTRPSQLNRLLREPGSTLVQELLSHVEFVIFEQDRQGRLSLLLRDLVELTE